MDEPQSAQSEREIRDQATRRVYAKVGLAWHALVFVISNAAMIALNLVYTPDKLWFVWPLAGWGTGLLLHAVAIFAGMGTTQQMIQKEIQRERQRRGLS
jgi:hypothetical protein